MTNKVIVDELKRLVCGNRNPIALTNMQVMQIINALDVQSTPEPMTLRQLVEKHTCLSEILEYRECKFDLPWLIDHGEHEHADCTAMFVVRGIVKAKCDGLSASWDWKQDGVHWVAFIGSGGTRYRDTELEAIDALLTAMEGQ